MLKSDLRITKTKQALEEALLTLLQEKPLKSISITEICRLAKINRGTFYLHYGQIEDLFEEYYKEIMKDLTDSYQEPYRHVDILNPRELNPSTIRIFHHIETYKNFYRIVFSRTVPMSYYYLLFNQVQDLLKRDMELTLKTSVDPAMLSAYQANAILGLIIEWGRNDFQQPAEDMNLLLVRILNIQTESRR
ncbi:transcriptional regulator [Planococcus glaciei]|uniref:TetR/AcrR family transcriptional regulator n=1 Tax=Planococcus glaciei TaxID=459472 RepID=A0A7H8QAF5_9BACL|nr:TetR/AcrR family transcriptional regulator [Planococcus glaciei]KOF10663.1 transcriptional regulator [Planococcus glaciei]MBX0315387.1 TetR/AcrR family transcriptional regulator [Planococcus glaciei]QDY45748.1 TetR/AcrR family transcriptional regulator [Planococcus glaciei]QKX50978.1 TetR/AcrR family transcriptional regulator [Planococcus glaciei]